MDDEEFVDIKDYEGLYKINRKGEVLGVKYNKILKPFFENGNYIKIGLNKNNKRKWYDVNKLVREHFEDDNLKDFVDIIGYEGLYKVNIKGDVFSNSYNKII